MLASGGRDGSVWLWDARTGLPLRELEQHHDDVGSLEFDRSGHWLLSASDDKMIMVWGVSGSTRIRGFENKNMRAVTAARFSPDGKNILFIDDTERLQRQEL
jgi:centriolar protein POC1